VRQRGGSCEVFVGWCLGEGLKWLEASSDVKVRSFMGGNGARHLSGSEFFNYVPVRYSHLPRALASWLSPYTLLLSVRQVGATWHLGTEAGWIPAAIEHAERIIVRPNSAMPATTAIPELRRDSRFSLHDGHSAPPEVLDPPVIDDVSRHIAERIVGLLPEGAAIQFGPGPIGAACVAMLKSPTRIRSGIVSDVVSAAVRRGTVVGTPVGAYAVGTHALYDDLAGRGWVDRVERTHDHRSLSNDDFFALNTALEIDLSGQVNVENIRGTTVAGLGGHADFAFAAASSRRGVSIVALPSRRGSTSTLVERLTENVTTQRSDIDVVVNENGVADLRGLSDRERSRALAALWKN
jgi:hypothetical protein